MLVAVVLAFCSFPIAATAAPLAKKPGPRVYMSKTSINWTDAVLLSMLLKFNKPYRGVCRVFPAGSAWTGDKSTPVAVAGVDSKRTHKFWPNVMTSHDWLLHHSEADQVSPGRLAFVVKCDGLTTSRSKAIKVS